MKSIEAMHNLNPETLEDIMTAANVTITPNNQIMSYKQGSLINLTKAQIQRALGFAPNVQDDEDKVAYSWGFDVDGNPCAIWDYKGSHRFNRWSYYDPAGVLPAIFDRSNIEEGFL